MMTIDEEKEAPLLAGRCTAVGNRWERAEVSNKATTKAFLYWSDAADRIAGEKRPQESTGQRSTPISSVMDVYYKLLVIKVSALHSLEQLTLLEVY